MKIHRMESTQILPIPVDEAWGFFSHPKNLDDMTPPGLGFQTISGDDEKMFAGQIIVHKIKIVPPIWTNWVTEIKEVEEGHYFIDEQRSGPYRFWHHLHRFEACEQGTLALDRVHYALPFFPFGEVGLPLIQKQLDQIFSFRKEYLEKKFGSA